MPDLKRRAVAAALSAALLIPLAAVASKAIYVSGLSGGQDSKSKALIALSPSAANEAARRDLLSVLQPAGKFALDLSQNVESMTFFTHPYETSYRYVCREDRVSLQYRLGNRVDSAGKFLEYEKQPAGVEAQPVFHIEQLPVPGFMPGSGSHPATLCDAAHPGTAAKWFAAPNATDAVRAANMFRMAQDEMKAGRLTPSGCDNHGSVTCSQWIRSLDDPSKIESVEACTLSTGDEACYVISFGNVDITITGKIPRNAWQPITPSTITTIRAEDVFTVFA